MKYTECYNKERNTKKHFEIKKYKEKKSVWKIKSKLPLRKQKGMGKLVKERKEWSIPYPNPLNKSSRMRK